MISQVWSSFKEGLREGPVIFFAPVIVVWRVLSREFFALLRELEAKHQTRRSRPR